MKLKLDKRRLTLRRCLAGGLKLIGCLANILVLAVLLAYILPAYGQAQVPSRPKVVLALGGGGTRGAAHVGVLRVLQQEGIPVDMIVGTSMGAIVGGFYCAGLSLDEIEAKFDKPHIMRNYMPIPLSVRLAVVPLFAIPHLLGWHPYDGFYFGTKFHHYLSRCLPENKRAIEDLNLPFQAVCTNLLDGKEYVISKGPLARAMQASSAIPVLRRPVPYDDALLVDGAIVANVPVDAARAAGADFVIAVDVDERLHRLPADHFRKIDSVAPRIEQISLSHDDLPQLKQADIIIHPHVDGIGVLSCKAKDAKAAIRAGETAARAAIAELRQKLQASGGTTAVRTEQQSLSN